MIKKMNSHLNSRRRSHPDDRQADAGYERAKRVWICVFVAVAIWAAHFGKATRREDQSHYPPMNFVIEALFSYGRYLCLVGFLAALLIFFTTNLSFSIQKVRGSVFWLVILNLFLSFKILVFGNDQFFFEASVVIGLSVFVLVVVVSELELRSIFSSGSEYSKVAFIGIIFSSLLVGTNLFAIIFYPSSAFQGLEGSRMHGTTPNPQALALVCALSVAPVVYWMRRCPLFSLVGFLSSSIYIGFFIIIYYTGSRMGFLALILITLVSCHEWIVGSKFATGFLVIFVVLALLGPFFLDDLSDLIGSRFVEGRVDSRSEGWLIAWESFLENPIFGVAPDEFSRRLLFVENFVLASASTGGFFALFLSIIVVWGILLSSFSLRRWKKVTTDKVVVDMYLSIVSSVLVVSMFEAALLGIFAAHTMLSYIYIGILVNLPFRLSSRASLALRSSYPRTRWS